MKLSIILTLIATLNVSASLYSQDTKLNFTVKDKTVKEVIKLIENQSNFRFFFSDDYLDLNKKVSLTAQNKNINEVLNDLLIESTVTYKVLDNNVVVITPASAQQMKISGVITDAQTKEALPGVNVIVKGTTRGTTSDIDGKFTIEINNGDVLTFSYIGYISQDVAVAGQSNLNVALEPDVKKLDEVVVVGYGVLKKSDLTGSVSSIKSSDIQANKAANVLQVMQGKVSGLDITQSTGQAGSGVNILLRGNRSLSASNAPLIMVDGVEYGSNLDLNPSDIESMEVLKDGASTAIYGTRGANGVILITTKKGGQGKTHVTFHTYTSFNSPSYVPKIMNAQQFKQKMFQTLISTEEISRFQKEGISYNKTTGKVTWDQNSYPNPLNVFGSVNIDTLMRIGIANGSNPRIRIYNTPDSLLAVDTTTLGLMSRGVSLDYLDMIFKNSITQNYELGITGGDEKTALNFSLGYMDDRGLLRGDKMRRYNVKLGADHKLVKFAKIGASVLFTNKKFERRNSSIFNQALKTGPIGVLYNDDGTYNTFPDKKWTTAQPNPLLDEVSGSNVNEIFDNRIFSSAYLQLDLIKGLTFKSNFGFDMDFRKQGVYNSPLSLAQLSANTANTEMTNYSSWSYTWDNILTYKFNIDKHDIQAMAGSSTQSNHSEQYYMKAVGQKNPETEYYDWSVFSNATPTSDFIESQMASVFGRINYKFNEKYLFQFTYRTDGSSVLNKRGPNRWASFPSASVGWRISEEEFLKGSSLISNLKMRLSWGIAGNASVQPYQSLSSVNTTPTYVALNGNIYSSYSNERPENPDLSWEKTTTYDIGFDFGLLNNRINGTIDLYQSETNGLIFKKPLPITTGYTYRIENAGASLNKGIEISFNTLNIKTNKFEWSTDWSFAANKEDLTRLYESLGKPVENVQLDNESWYRKNEPLNIYYTYRYDGVYSISDMQKELDYVKAHAGDSIPSYKIPMLSNGYLPGDIKLYDKPDSTGHGDGKITDYDKVVMNRSPKFTFGFSNNFSINTELGTFGLSVMVYGRIGQTIRYDNYIAYKDGKQTVENGPYVDAWTPTNQGAEFPRYATTGTSVVEMYKRPMAFVDGSFVKIKDITLSYSFPKTITNKLNVANLRLYATAKNMFTFSELGNYDTELGGTMNFPLAKQFIVGLNLDF